MNKTDLGAHTCSFCRLGAPFPTRYLPLPFSQDAEGPDSTPSAHLTCSILTVGFVTATFVKQSKVDMETLLRLRLQDCGKGVRNESYIPWASNFLCSPGEEGDSGRGGGKTAYSSFWSRGKQRSPSTMFSNTQSLSWLS